MTVATTTDFTISHTVDQAILVDLENEFDGFRSRIASLCIEASSTLTSMFGPLAPADTEVIDIPAIEWEQVKLELVPAHENVEELAAA